MRKKKNMISFAVLCLVVVLIVIAFPVASRFTGQHGLVDGKLRICRLATNCVCSEENSPGNIMPIDINGQPAVDMWQKLLHSVRNNGGDIRVETDQYLWATFETPIMRFVDDVEARLDLQNNFIHIRSASRIGRSDLGVNRRRVEQLKAAVQVENIQ